MQVASPTIELVVDHVDSGAAVVSVSGVPGHADAAVLRHTLEGELDRAPALLVVVLDRPVSTPELRAVLAAARDRARAGGGGLRVVVGHGTDREITDLL